MKTLLIIFPFVFLQLTLYGQLGPLLWEDNFNEGQLDLGKWSHENGIGVNGDWLSGQPDCATSRPANVSFQYNIPGTEFPSSVFIDRVQVYSLEDDTRASDEKLQPEFILNPNPGDDKLHFELESPEEYALKIIDSSGKIISQKYPLNLTQIDISSLYSLSYFRFLNNGK